MKSLLALLALAGCDLDYQADVGELSPPDATLPDTSAIAFDKCADSDPMTPVSLALQVRPVLSRCTSCHGASATSGFNVLTYDSLRAGGQLSGTHVIVPGKPCESLIVQKLGPAPPYGTRMPYNGPPYLSNGDLTLVRDWIAEGALDN